MTSPKKSPVSQNRPEPGTPITLTLIDIFPTTSPLKLYEHRAGVLDYPSPTKTKDSFALSPSQQRDIRSQREAEKRSAYLQQVREQWVSPSRQNPSGNEWHYQSYGKPSQDSAEEDQQNQRKVSALEEEITQERKRTEDLEERLSSLTRVTQNLFGAIKESQNILKASVDDPATQSVLKI
jgi:hypothetical protein